MTQSRRDPDSFLPLSPSVFHILLAMVDRDRHGYGIIKEVDRRTGGKLRLSTGTLYAAIKRLRLDGLVEETDPGIDPELDDDRRRYYGLTPLGSLVVRRETARLQELVGLSKRAQRQAKPSTGDAGGG